MTVIANVQPFEAIHDCARIQRCGALAEGGSESLAA